MQNSKIQTEIDVILNGVRSLYRNQQRIALYKLIYQTHPADMAWVFRHLDEVERRDIFKYISRMNGSGEFLSNLDESLITEILTPLPAENISPMIAGLDSDDIVEILDALDTEKVSSISVLLEKSEQDDLSELTQYPEESAGRIMNTHFLSFSENYTVNEAIQKFQSIGNKLDMTFYIYVVGVNNQLKGVLSLRQLLLSSPQEQLTEVMHTTIVSVTPETDQEKAAQLVSQYNYFAIPVVDSGNQLLGIVTVDDVIDIIHEEATEDILKLAGVGNDTEILLRPLSESVKTRFPWLFTSWIGGIIALWIIGHYNVLLSSTVALASFIPVIMGMGGNIGMQTSTIIIRGIATGHVNIQNSLPIVFKEIAIGTSLGIIYGLFLGFLAFFKYIDTGISFNLGLVVGISVCFSMVISVCFGSLVPIFLEKSKIDPAISTGPFVTTAIDILGIAIYFYTAQIFLDI